MKILFSLLSAIIIVASCQKVIDVDLNDANPKVVIEANYTAEDSTVLLKLSLTTSYFEPSTPSTLNGAIVNIIDGNGIATPLVSIGNGEYELTAYVPAFNTTYKMTVLYDGTTYTATSLLPNIVPLSPITYEFSPGFFGFGEGYFVNEIYDDPAGVPNFYLAILSKNGRERNKVTDFIMGDDRLSDGNPVTRPLFIDTLFSIGDTIDLELQSIDEKIFDYYSEIQSIAGSGQATAAPSNPISVWNNDALGYFSAYGNSRQTVIIL
ncbi:MAG TPA: DUF4249 domain-containing protein [Crocinitomicaceae bacterium]|nr:DUF4249 domain-containing protein [Crocinitomicaceae bacterium]